MFCNVRIRCVSPRLRDGDDWDEEIMPDDIACSLFGVISLKSSKTAYKASFGSRKSTELLSPDFIGPLIRFVDQG
jgi:hypothetical protein